MIFIIFVMPRRTPLLPISVRRSLAALGADLQRARRRRRLTTMMVAERAHITRPTLLRVERGDPAVSLGVYATVLWVLGFGDRLARLAASETDAVGLTLEDERLPKRISSRRPRAKGGGAAATEPARDASTGARRTDGPHE
jgi:DNA-binding XRE family transcriptional regulator